MECLGVQWSVFAKGHTFWVGKLFPTRLRVSMETIRKCKNSLLRDHIRAFQRQLGYLGEEGPFRKPYKSLTKRNWHNPRPPYRLLCNWRVRSMVSSEKTMAFNESYWCSLKWSRGLMNLYNHLHWNPTIIPNPFRLLERCDLTFSPENKRWSVKRLRASI